jgi:hypothetical protein
VFFSVLFGFPMVTFLMMRDAEPGTSGQCIHGGPQCARPLSLPQRAAFYAFTTIPLAQVYAILFAAPLLITILAIPILGERVGIHRALAVLVGLGGVIVVLQPATTTLTLGHIAAVVAAVGSAFASVIMRKIGREERSVVLILYPMAANFVLMGAAMPFVYEPMPGQDLALLAADRGTGAYRHEPDDLRLPRRPCRDRRADAVFADHLGLRLWRAVLRRGAGMGYATGNGDHRGVGGLYIVFREDRGGRSTTTPVLRTRSRMASPSAPRVAPVPR